MTEERTFICVNRSGGGLVIIPIEELGLVTTLTLEKRGDDNEVIGYEMDNTKAAIYIKCLRRDLIVDHSVGDIQTMLSM